MFDAAYYSAPHRLIGQTLWVRAADTSVTLFHAHEVIASYPRAARPGHRQTHPDHLPPAKVVALMASPAWCVRRAHDIGPQTTELIGRLLASDRSTGCGVLWRCSSWPTSTPRGGSRPPVRRPLDLPRFRGHLVKPHALADRGIPRRPPG